MGNQVLYAFLLTLLAGLATGFGGFIAFFIKQKDFTKLSLGLGFSAGVMIYVSFVEILDKSTMAMTDVVGLKEAKWITLVAFFAGILIAFLVDWFLPETINQDELETDKDDKNDNAYAKKLHRMGLFTALAIAIHNFPEGLATFMAGLTDLKLGASIAVAIAIHNIPEGIAVSLPIYNATGDKKKALWYTFLSGFAEPVGAILGYFILLPIFSPLTFGIVFAGVAGIMVYIAFDELLPAAREYGNPHIAIFGVSGGMFVMAVSLLLF